MASLKSWVTPSLGANTVSGWWADTARLESRRQQDEAQMTVASRAKTGALTAGAG